MLITGTKWQVELDVDNQAAYAVFATDRLWNGYSIADLEPPLRTYTKVAVARKAETGEAAACLVLTHPTFCALVPHGPAEGLQAILQAYTALPLTPFILAQEHHLSTLEDYYVFNNGLEAMQRMVVDPTSFQAAPTAQLGPERLSMAALPALYDLYQAYPSNAFNADQLQYGLFYGLYEGEMLVAAGGTHVLAPNYSLAAVGNVYTRPSTRGKGYARAIVTKIVEELLAQRYRDIILNVAATNASAIRIYSSLGFRVHTTYWEGRAKLRAM